MVNAIPWTIVGAWGLLVLVGAHHFRPVPRRIRQVTRPQRLHAASAGTLRVPPRRVTRFRNPDRLITVFILIIDLMVGPMPAIIMCAALVGYTVLRRRGRTRCHEDCVITELPHAIELLSLAVASGFTPRLALQTVAPQLHGPVGEAFRCLAHELANGARTVDAIERLPERLGDPSRSVVAALLDSERYGAALGPTLEGLGVDARFHRRRHAEEQARRLPVKLLFPLVFCVLPAFVLLTVVPILLATLERLKLP